jgi:hypothetical protein
MTLPELFAEYRKATEALDAAEKAEGVARSRATQCRNEVNNLQKKIDAEIEKERKEARWDTDWAAKRRETA